jgi:hypothetical protein
MRYWVIALTFSLVWVGLALGGMFLHTRGEDSFLGQKYVQIAACGFVAIWSFAILLRILTKSGKPKQ